MNAEKDRCQKCSSDVHRTFDQYTEYKCGSGRGMTGKGWQSEACKIICAEQAIRAKVETENDNLLETLASIYTKLGLREDEVSGKELVSDTIANRFNQLKDELARANAKINETEEKA